MSELQTQNTGFKNPLKTFTSDHADKIAKALGLIIIITIIAFFASRSEAATVSVKEIQENSAKWKEIQAQIEFKASEQDRLTSEINSLLDQQNKFKERNELLRQLFTSAKNPK